jgi:hypothetical protein
MIGIGLQAAGISGAGTGQATDAARPPIPAQGAPFLTSQGDYVIDPVSGDIGRTTSVRSRVNLALQTTAASATADTSLGEAKPSKIGTSFTTDAVASTRRALQPMVDDGSISLDDVSVDVLSHTPGTVSRTVSYTDLLQQAADKANS